MLGTTNEDGGWEKGGFGVSADEKPSTTAAQSCNIVYGVKKGKRQGKLAQRFDWHGQWGFRFD